MLRQSDCVKLITASGGGSLEANSGESFLVKGIFVYNSENETYLTAKIDNFSVGYFRCKGKSGSHLGNVSRSELSCNFLDFLVKRGLPFTYPVAEGQKFSVSRVAEAGEVTILYDRYDAGDIRSDMPNGTNSKNFAFLQYMRETTVLTASGDLLLDKAITPGEFPDFPAGKSVPAGMTIILHGIAACPCADYDTYDNGFWSTYLKLVKNREILFDEDRKGIRFVGHDDGGASGDYKQGRSIIGSHVEYQEAQTVIPWKEAFMFDVPLVFNSGEELLIYVSFLKAGTHTMPANLVDVALILEVNRV